MTSHHQHNSYPSRRYLILPGHEFNEALIFLLSVKSSAEIFAVILYVIYDTEGLKVNMFIF